MALLSEIGVEIKRVEILQILKDAEDHQSRFNKALAELGRPPEKHFWIRAEYEAAVGALREEIARLTPPPPELSAWEEDKLAQQLAKAAPQSTTDARSLFDMLSAALRDRRVTAELFVELARPLCLLGRSRAPPDPTRQHAIRSWLDMNVVAFGGQSAPAADASPPPVKDAKAKAAEIARLAAIGRGEVVELPSNKTARAIIAAGAKRRGEKDKL